MRAPANTSNPSRERERERERERASAQQTILERPKIRGLKWFDHLMKMEQDRLLHELFKWVLPGKKKRQRPRNESIVEIIE